MVTHDLHLVKTFNHRVITIKNGTIESDYPDASHIDVEPYRFDDADEAVGSYFVEEVGEDLDFLVENYAAEVAEESADDASSVTDFFSEEGGEEE